MINSQELLFTVDENNTPIEPVERSRAHVEGIWHRTTDIAVVNSKNEILCHKRSLLKDTGPGNWDVCFGGHTLVGVDSQIAAAVELKEESGLVASEEELKYIATIKYVSKSGKNNEFRYLYIYKWDGELESLELEKDEIDEVRWVGLEEIIKNRDNQEAWSPMPHLDYLIVALK